MRALPLTFAWWLLSSLVPGISAHAEPATSPSATTSSTASSAASSAGQPSLTSRNVVVLDAATGVELLGKAPDEIRPIASTTKIFVALAVRKAGMDLDGWTEISRADATMAKGGARTRLDIGQTFRNRDLLRAMLLASDNRAPNALGRAAGLDTEGLVKAMNAVARDLSLKKTRFTDPSGLRGNVSTARELALALRAALEDPVLREILGEQEAQVISKSKYAKVHYRTTNLPLLAGKHQVLGGKTGYTRAAGYCFVSGAKAREREVVAAVLGAERKAERFADFERALTWLQGEGAGRLKLDRPAARKPALRVEAAGSVPRQGGATAAGKARRR